jgi:hypothetical protein
VNQPKDFPPADAPFGTHPRRTPAPRIALVMIFALWFGFLVWLAARYPAR